MRNKHVTKHFHSVVPLVITLVIGMALLGCAGVAPTMVLTSEKADTGILQVMDRQHDALISIPGIEEVVLGRSKGTGQLVIKVVVQELPPELLAPLPQDLEGLEMEPLAIFRTTKPQPDLLAPMRVDQLALWTFDGSPAFSQGRPIAPTSAAGGAPTLTMFNAGIDDNGKDGRVYTDTNGISHPAGRAAGWDDIKKNNAPDAELVMKIDTTDWYDFLIRFDYRSEFATGYNLDYSLNDGSSWGSILVQDSIVPGFSWQTEVIDLTDLDVIENRSSLWLRVDHMEDTGNDKFVFDRTSMEIAKDSMQEADAMAWALFLSRYCGLRIAGLAKVLLRGF